MNHWKCTTDEDVETSIQEVRRMLAIQDDDKRLYEFAPLSMQMLASLNGEGALADLMKVYADTVRRLVQCDDLSLEECFDYAFGLLNQAIEGQLAISDQRTKEAVIEQEQSALRSVE